MAKLGHDENPGKLKKKVVYPNSVGILGNKKQVKIFILHLTRIASCYILSDKSWMKISPPKNQNDCHFMNKIHIFWEEITK